MRIDRAYLNHSISCAPHCDLRNPASLCLIDGAILGGLPAATEHMYRVQHLRDCYTIYQRIANHPKRVTL